MPGFYFSNVPKFKIRCSGVVDDIPSPLPAPVVAFVSGVAIQQAPEIMRTCVSVVKFWTTSKRKATTNSKNELFMPEKGIEDVGRFSKNLGDAVEILASEIEDYTLHDRGVSWTPIHHPTR
ncbi:hypothetical protein Fot_42626 [Forsythia ovata]|uniref:Uncharacterized protein n=1 Tax=Forsythia ovata TaxID=205694 RepID=A0ABD1RLP7_9LAMI